MHFFIVTSMYHFGISYLQIFEVEKIIAIVFYLHFYQRNKYNEKQ